MNPIGIFIKYERVKQHMSQEALAEGICSNTYLSKIESGFNNANEEIISLLVEALGYTYNTEDSDRFTILSDDIWRRLILFELKEEEYDENIRTLMNALAFSDVSMDVLLLQSLADLIINDTLNPSLLNIELKLLSEVQLHRYFCLLSYYNYINDGKTDLLIAYDDHYGYISYYKAALLFLEGKYRQTLLMAEKVYDMFSKQGNIMGMINISFLESSSHSNLNDIQRQIEVSERIETLNHYVKEEHVDFYINYNLGSSYLVQNNYEQGELHLKKCLAYDFGYDSQLVYEKLTLLYLLTYDFINAEKYLNEIDQKALLSYGFLKRMFEVKNDLTDDTCISELERCYENEINHHHGRSMLFGALLYSAYRSTYQYPKAIKVLETLVYNEIPLFFKK